MAEVTDPFAVPSDLGEAAAKRYVDANGVERSSWDDRPYIRRLCDYYVPGPWEDVHCADGRVPGKRAGTTKQCPACKGRGFVEERYTRCTTFISCLEDTTMLKKWAQRVVLLGIGTDHEVYGRLLAADLDDRGGLNAIADAAFESGDGYLAARRGTDMHELTEAWDRMEPFEDVDDEAMAGLRAYVGLCDRHGLEPLDIERFVVSDHLRVAGTPDRRWARYVDSRGVERRNVCGDLKTGSLDFSAGKFAMQMAVYAQSDGYDPETLARKDLGWDREVGLLVHVRDGEASLYEVDLLEGARGIGLAVEVRAWRNVKPLRKV